MNKTSIPVVIVIVALCIAAGSASAQEGKSGPAPGRQGGFNLPSRPGDQENPGLSDQQKEQMRKLTIAFAEKTLPLRNELAEKQAHLHSLMTARETDHAAIDRVVDEIGNLGKELFKAKIANDLKVNELLTEEQRAMRDMHHGGPGPGMPGLEMPGMEKPGPGMPPPGDEPPHTK